MSPELSALSSPLDSGRPAPAITVLIIYKNGISQSIENQNGGAAIRNLGSEWRASPNDAAVRSYDFQDAQHQTGRIWLRLSDINSIQILNAT